MVDRLLHITLWFMAALGAALSLLIVVFLAVESAPLLADIGPGRFLFDASWHPTEALFGAAPMLWGSILVTAGSVAIAAPLGVLSGVFVHFHAPPAVRPVYRTVVEVLAGVPSVVYGFWGLIVLVPLITRLQPPGASLLAGIIILSMMVLPTMAVAADAAIAGVSTELIRASTGLGMSREATVVHVVLPVARHGLISGFILQFGRAIGETMAVLMVCGNVVQLPGSIFDPVRTLTANIALEMAYATGNHRSALFVTGLALMLLVTALVLSADAMGKRQAVSP